MEKANTGGSLARRALAVVVLAVAAYILLKLTIGFFAAIAGTVAVIVAIVAIIWAISVLWR